MSLIYEKLLKEANAFVEGRIKGDENKAVLPETALEFITRYVRGMCMFVAQKQSNGQPQLEKELYSKCVEGFLEKPSFLFKLGLRWWIGYVGSALLQVLPSKRVIESIKTFPLAEAIIVSTRPEVSAGISAVSKALSPEILLGVAKELEEKREKLIVSAMQQFLGVDERKAKLHYEDIFIPLKKELYVWKDGKLVPFAEELRKRLSTI